MKLAIVGFVMKLIPEVKTPSAWALILANLIPLVGLVFFELRVTDLLILYWAENVVIGFYNIFKMAVSGGGIKGSPFAALKLFLVPFFCVHYGFFAIGHFAFLTAVFEDVFGSMSMNLFNYDLCRQILIDDQFMLLALVGLIFSHGFSFFSNYIGKGEYKSSVLPVLMFKPYARVFALHIALFIAAFVIMMFDSYLILGIFFVLMKLFIDLICHEASHRVKIGTNE